MPILFHFDQYEYIDNMFGNFNLHYDIKKNVHLFVMPRPKNFDNYLQDMIKSLHINSEYPPNENQDYLIDKMAEVILYSIADVMTQHSDTNKVREYTKKEEDAYTMFYKNCGIDSTALAQNISTIIEEYKHKMVEPYVCDIEKDNAFAASEAPVCKSPKIVKAHAAAAAADTEVTTSTFVIPKIPKIPKR